MYLHHGTVRSICMTFALLLLAPFCVRQVFADDCATYTAPLSVPPTTKAEYAINVALGNQRRLAFVLEVAVAPYRYDDAVELLERIEATLLPHLPPGVPVYNYDYFVFDRTVEEQYASVSDGGPIRVSEKLILESESVDVLAFVIAHEMSHPIYQDTKRFLDALYDTAIDYGERLREDARITDPALKKERDKKRVEVLEQGSVNKETLMRPHEYDADVFSAHVATSAGYNPEFMARFFERVAENRTGDPSPTHPVESERAALLRCFSAIQRGPAHEDLDALFRTVQGRLYEQRRAIDAAARGNR